MSSKTPKRPLPPGIPVESYSTPNLSDLLVVEDHDSRLPGYRAVPYGTDHPNAVLYSGYKLVYQMPLDNEANYNWVRRIYAAERLDQSAYNAAIKYSSNHTTFPIYIRTSVLLRSTYTPAAFGSVDPVFAGATLVEEEMQRLKDDQDDGQLDSLYVKVVRAYETLPGPILTTTSKGSAEVVPAKFKAQRQFITTVQAVLPSATPDNVSPTVIESIVKQTDNSNKAEKITTTIDAPSDELIGKKLTPQQQVATMHELLIATGASDDTLDPTHYGVEGSLLIDGGTEPLGNGQSIRSIGIVPQVFAETAYKSEKSSWAVPHKFKAARPQLTTTQVMAGTVATSDVTLALHDMEASTEQVTVYKKKVSKTTMPPGNVTVVGTRTGMWGTETVSDSLTDTVGYANGAYLTKDHIVEPLGDGRANETLTTFPSQPATLVEYLMDEQHHILIKKVKKLVSTQNYTPPTPPDGGTVEMNPIDAWNGIEIVSSIGGSLPASETWTHIVQHQFPEELTEVGVVYEKTISTSGSAGGVNVPQIGMNSWELSSEANASATVRAVPYSTIKAGYSGPVKASTTRSYYSSPPLEVETVTLVIPVYGTIIVSGNEASLKNSGYIRGSNGVWLSSGGANGGSAGVVAVRHQFGPVLHNSPGLTTTGDATVTASQAATSGSPPFGGTYPVSVATVTATLEATLRLPACSHTPFVTGNTLIVQVLVEKWRFGVWIKEVTTITHP